MTSFSLCVNFNQLIMAAWSHFEKDSMAMFELKGKRYCDGLAMSATGIQVGAGVSMCGNIWRRKTT